MTLIEQSPAIFSAWLLWCGLHSLLASTRVRGKLVAMGLKDENYRLIYVTFSIASLALLMGWELSTVEIPRPENLYWQIIRGLCFLYATTMFLAGAKQYDLKTFLGLGNNGEQGKRKGLKTNGILSRVRHPWYSGGLALACGLGATPLDRIDLRILLAVYLVVGCMIEERRLAREFGSAFSQYKKRVPMLIPRVIKGQGQDKGVWT